MIDVDAGEAKEMARRAAREEGMLIGISSGAALAGVAQKLPELGDHPRILSFNYDTGERYLSVPDFLPKRLKPPLTAFLCSGVNSAPLNFVPQRVSARRRAASGEVNA